MELDTYLPFGQIHASGAEFTNQFLDISKCIVLRERSQTWAHNLRFLCLPRSSTAYNNPRNPAFDDVETCLHCERWPIFAKTMPEYLWLTDYGELPDCIHYIAISYCWRLPEDNTMPVEEPFDIMTKRGRRKGRAPRDIAERAIKYASRHGIRLIWIDQECIEQDNREDKEYGIQSMDLVYSRSLYPVGLLNTLLTRQAQVDTLARIVARGERYFREEVHPSFEDASESETNQYLEALEVLANDKWFTRTWIFQEATLASERIVFLIPCVDSVQHPSFEAMAGEIILNADLMQSFTTGAVHIVADFLSRLKDQPDLPWTLRFVRAEHFITDRLAVGLDSLSHVCNVVTVIHVISKYNNGRVLDRLAIVANLCEYPIRINTAELEDKGYSFSTSLLALSLLNGDISLLQFWHEVSYFPSRVVVDGSHGSDMTNGQTRWETFSWAPSHIASIQPCHPLLGESPTRLSSCDINQSGLAMQGWLWYVDQEIDLGNERLRFLESWKTAVAEAETAIPRKWDDAGYLIQSLLETLKKQRLHDIENLIFFKVVRTAVKSLSYEETLSSKASPEITSSDLGTIILPEATSNLTNVDPDDSDVPKVFPRDALDTILDRRFPHSWQPWPWLICSIMENGVLYYGRLVGSKGNPSNSCGIFEYGSPGYFLTPCVHGQTQDELPVGFKDAYNSWAVQTTNESASSVQKLKGKGLVRGLWEIGDTEPQGYILS